jgi:hypothetical protein
MRRALTLSALSLTLFAFCAAAATAPPAALQLPQDIACPASVAPLSPLAPTPEPKVEDVLEAAGLVPDGAIAVDTLPSCPSVYSCPSAPNFICSDGNCTTSDTGYTACQSGSTAFSCPAGQTVHVKHCHCVRDFWARCCTRAPFCLCVKCKSLSSQSLYCA